MSQSPEEECVFCFEELSKYNVAILNCPHKYHLHCIQKWNKTSNNFTKVCPQCNVIGEIININKGDQSRPISTNSQDENNTQSRRASINQQQQPYLAQHTYYDQRFNIREVPLTEPNNNVIHPIRAQTRITTQNEEIDSTFLCCTIL